MLFQVNQIREGLLKKFDFVHGIFTKAILNMGGQDVFWSKEFLNEPVSVRMHHIPDMKDGGVDGFLRQVERSEGLSRGSGITLMKNGFIPHRD